MYIKGECNEMEFSLSK